VVGRIRDRLGDVFERRPLLAVVTGSALLGVIVTVDVVRLWQAYQVLGQRMYWPVVVGILVPVAAAVVGWVLRDSRSAVPMWVATGLAGVVLAGFFATHNAKGPPRTDAPDHPLEVAALACSSVLLLAAMVAIMIVGVRRARGRKGRQRPV
jgi:hypothetical protein